MFSHKIMSNSLWPNGLQHTRLPCPSLSPGVCSNSRPLSLWCHWAISSSIAPFSSCSQSFPASQSFRMSQVFASVTQILELQLQHQTFQWIFRVNFLILYKSHYLLPDIITIKYRWSYSLLWYVHYVKNLFVQQTTIFERIQNTWFKWFTLRAIGKQEPNSGTEVLFSAIISLIEVCLGIWGRVLNNTFFLEDDHYEIYLK